MKLRIENNSIRFRITLEELERLNRRSRLEAATQLFTADGKALEGEFIYALAVDTEGGPTRCLIDPSFIMLVLHPDSLEVLNQRGEQGYTYQRESKMPDGETRRFMAYVELDRPAKKRNRPEDWLTGDAGDPV